MRLRLAVVLTLVLCPAAEAAHGPGETFLISAPSGLETALPTPVGFAEIAWRSATTQTGRYVAFRSTSDALSSEDDDRYSNLFLRDTQSGTLRLVSRGFDGPGHGNSYGAAIAAPESSPRIVFTSDARLGVGDDDGGDSDVFVWENGNLQLISRSSGLNGPPGDGEAGEAGISADGTLAVFTTTAALDPADDNGVRDVYTRLLGAPYTTTWESRHGTAGGSLTLAGEPAAATTPSLNYNGSRVAFTTSADDVQGGVTDANGAGDVVVRLRATGSNTVMSTRNGLASTGNGGSGAPHLTGTSGTILYYTSTASNSGVTSPTTDTDPTQDIYRRVVGDDTSVLVSVNSAGEKATGYGELPAASRSGNIVSWSSNAQNLSTFQEQGYSNVFVRNMTTGVTTVHSRANGTFGAIGNKYSRSSAVSADGLVLVFATEASNVAAGALFGRPQVVRRILASASNANMSAPPGAAAGNPGGDAQLSWTGRQVSANGRYVVFRSNANGLSADDQDDTYDVFRRDTQTGETVLVSRATGAGPGADADVYAASISSDGRRIAFTTFASNLGTPDPGLKVFVRDLATGQTLLAGRADGAAGAVVAGAQEVAISGDGKRVAFSASDDLGEGAAGDVDVFVRDLAAGRTFPVSVADGPGDAYGNAGGEAPAIDATGRRVAFHTKSTNLGDGDTDADFDVHVRDLATGRTQLVSRGATVKGNGYSGDPSISGDGRLVAFDSAATNLDPADADDDSDIFLRDLDRGTTALVSRRGTAGPALGGHSSRPVLSLDGSAVGFRADDTGLLPGDDPAPTRGWVKRLATGEIALATRATGASGLVADRGIAGFDIDGDGSCVAFDTHSSNLAAFPVPSDAGTVWMRVLGAGCPDPATGPPGGPGADTTKPVLSGVKLSRKRFRVGKKATPTAAAKRGTTIRFTVSEAATLRITVGRKAAGRKVKGRCKPASRKLRKKPRCVRWVSRGTLTRAVPAGAGRVAFTGRVGRKALERGKHRFAVVAVDVAGNRSAPTKLKFKIVKR
ncbi:MAG: hypothetical protein ABW060_07860 [Solirubrobacteraceae bacterium]